MPPKRKPQNDDDHSDEERLDDQSDEDEEVWDPDYQEEHQTERKKKNTVFEEDGEGEEDAEADGEEAGDEEDDTAGNDVDYDIDTMEYQDDEVLGDPVEPPTPDIIKKRRVVRPEDRETSERLSMFECARVLGDRARHLENGARPNVDIKNCTSSLEIAYMELMEKRIPMAIIRKVGLGWVEVWRVKEMAIAKLPPIDYFMVQIK